MSVKEIKELGDEVREVSVAGGDDVSEDWEEKDFVSEDEDEEEDKVEEFSIGDTMLARGDAKDVWGSGDLEEELEEGFDEDFGFDDFENEDFGEESFSYDAIGSSSGDLYGASSSGADLYGASSSGADLYGASGSGSDSVSLYNASAGSSVAESSLYDTGAGTGKKDQNVMGSVYRVEGGARKGKRRGSKSGLEMGIRAPKARRSKGVSMI